jgi:hypothetical protein
MGWRRAARKLGKWAGFATVGLIVTLYLANLRWDVHIETPLPPQASIKLDSGCVAFRWEDGWTANVHDKPVSFW